MKQSGRLCFAATVLLTGVHSVPPMATASDNTLPACARSGSSSLIINGLPALKMSDVIDCPPELIEIIPSIIIDRQPMVHVKTGKGDDGTCVTRGSSDVMVAGESAQRAGDADCMGNQ